MAYVANGSKTHKGILITISGSSNSLPVPISVSLSSTLSDRYATVTTYTPASVSGLQNVNVNFRIFMNNGGAAVDGDTTLVSVNVTDTNPVTTPSTPGSITIAVGEGGALTIDWGSSTNATNYRLERQVNGGSWSPILTTTQRSHTEIAQSDWDTVRYRVRAYHSSGGYSAYRTSDIVTIIHNQPPVISGADADLGTFEDSFNIHFPPFQISDPDPADTVTVEIRLDGVPLGPAFIAEQNTDIIPTIAPDMYVELLNGRHTLEIIATDNNGAWVHQVSTFTKDVKVAEIKTNCRDANDMPTVARISPIGAFPVGCVLQVWACNNGYDADPAWQDVSSRVLAAQKVVFENTEKTADEWGIRVWAKLDRGTATGPCYLEGVRGVFQTREQELNQQLAESNSKVIEYMENVLQTQLEDLFPSELAKRSELRYLIKEKENKETEEEKRLQKIELYKLQLYAIDAKAGAGRSFRKAAMDMSEMLKALRQVAMNLADIIRILHAQNLGLEAFDPDENEALQLITEYDPAENEDLQKIIDLETEAETIRDQLKPLLNEGDSQNDEAD